jgi:putative endonuclease
LNAAERRAARHYRLRGYRILATNAWAGPYELDVVARRGRRLVFCEVKSRADALHGAAHEMVGAEKQRRVRRAAEAWLQQHPELRALDVRFDVVAVDGSALTRVADAF